MKLDAMLTDPAGAEAWRLDETEILAAVPELVQDMRRREALLVRLVHEADQRCLPEHAGAADTNAWLAGITRMHRAHASQIVRLSRELPLHPQVADVLNEGRIELGHVQVIVNFLGRLAKLTKDFGIEPADTDWDHPDPDSGRADDCEAYLLIAARIEDPKQLRDRAREMEIFFERDNDLPSDGENPELNEFHASSTFGGRVHVSGSFDAETGEALQTALSGLSKPHPSTDDDGHPIRDPRTAAKRNADALEQIIRGHLDNARGPTEGGERPHVTVTIDVDALKDAVAATAPTPATGAWSGNGWDYHSDNATGPISGEHCDGCTDVRPPRHYRRRRHATMPWAGPISAAIAARISCDAQVTAIFVDRSGNPLDVGRTTRIVSPKLRKALVARDCGCAFPGCGRPAAWTDAHPPPSTSCREVPPSGTGPTAVPQHFRTSCCSARSTTRSSTGTTGRWPSAMTAIHGSPRQPGWTRCEDPGRPTTDARSTEPDQARPEHSPTTGLRRVTRPSAPVGRPP